MARRKRYRYGPDPFLKLVPYTYPPSEWRIGRLRELDERIEHWQARHDEDFSSGQHQFRHIFDSLLKLVIHDTMVDLHKQLRNKGMHGKCATAHRTCQYKQEHFEIHPQEKHGVFFRLSAYGNHHLQCVCICLTFLKRQRQTSSYMDHYDQLKVITHSLHPKEIKSELFPKLVNQGIYHARKLGGKQSGAA